MKKRKKDSEEKKPEKNNRISQADEAKAENQEVAEENSPSRNDESHNANIVSSTTQVFMDCDYSQFIDLDFPTHHNSLASISSMPSGTEGACESQGVNPSIFFSMDVSYK